MKRCYKCGNLTTYAHGNVKIKIESPTYSFDAELCEDCAERIEKILEINGRMDEEKSDG